MNTLVIVVIGVLALVVLYFLGLAFKRMAERKLRSKLIDIPQDILEQFTEAEKQLKESKGEKTPYEIMWDIATKNYKGGINGKDTTKAGREETNSGGVNPIVSETEQPVAFAEVHGKFEQRSDISTGTSDDRDADTGSDKQPAEDNRKNIFARRK